MTSRRWLRAAPWLAALMVALAIAAPEAGEWLCYRDATEYLYPNEQVLRDALGAGRLPHWNPWIWGGLPHLADPPTQSLYPLRWLTAALPLSVAPHAFLALHLLLAGAGAGRLARVLGARTAGQCLAAAAFPATGFLISLQENLPLLAGAAWWAWSLALALELARARRRIALRAALLGGSGALMVLGGDPQAAGVAALCAATLLLVRAGARRAATRGALAAAIALGLAAPVLLPARALAPHTTRSIAWPVELAQLWSTSPWRLVELWTPWPFGAPWPDPFAFPGRVPALVEGDRTELFADTLYPGALVPLLALAGLAASGRSARTRRALALLALGSALLALGRHAPFHELARAVLPGFDRLRYPEKLLLLPALIAPVLAAAGFDALRGRAARVRALGVGLGLGLLLLVLARPLASGLSEVAGLASRLELGALRLLCLVAMAAGALALAGRARGRARLGWLLLAAAIAAGDPLFVTRERRWTASAPPWSDDACLAALRAQASAVASDGLPGRVGGGAPAAAFAGETMADARRRATPRAGPGHELVQEQGFASFAPLRGSAARMLAPELRWKLLGTRALIAPREGELPSSCAILRDCPERGWRALSLPRWPRAWCVPRAATASACDLSDAYALVSRDGFDPHAHAVLEGAPASLAPFATPLGTWAATSLATSTVRGRELADGSLELEVDVREPVTLVVSVAPFPGWEAEVDGERAEVHPASLACLGVPLEPGSHRVRLAFSTPGFWPGVLLALLTVVGLFVGARVRARSSGVGSSGA